MDFISAAGIAANTEKAVFLRDEWKGKNKYCTFNSIGEVIMNDGTLFNYKTRESDYIARDWDAFKL